MAASSSAPISSSPFISVPPLLASAMTDEQYIAALTTDERIALDAFKRRIAAEQDATRLQLGDRMLMRLLFSRKLDIGRGEERWEIGVEWWVGGGCGGGNHPTDSESLAFRRRCRFRSRECPRKRPRKRLAVWCASRWLTLRCATICFASSGVARKSHGLAPPLRSRLHGPGEPAQLARQRHGSFRGC